MNSVDAIISGQLEEKCSFSHGTTGKGRPPIGPGPHRRHADFLFAAAAYWW